MRLLMSHKLRLNDFSSDTNKRDAASVKPISPNWKYAGGTLVLCMAIAIPQFSEWIESQIPTRLPQQIVQKKDDVAVPWDSTFPTTIGTPISSGFGWRIHPLSGKRQFHSGIDFAAAQGTPIYAYKAGLVEFAQWRGSYGISAIIDHGLGKKTVYAHASELVVKEGEKVDKGQMIGNVGSTGASTAPHLHFEVLINDKAVNPRPYLQQSGGIGKK
ncbi:MAG: M23 family metallopeptidase [Richelia sp. RM1_1_1]|nr:M23 family metallopeptidase [Richelia sp. RM1_1_1]